MLEVAMMSIAQRLTAASIDSRFSFQDGAVCFGRRSSCYG